MCVYLHIYVYNMCNILMLLIAAELKFDGSYLSFTRKVELLADAIVNIEYTSEYIICIIMCILNHTQIHFGKCYLK